MNVSYRALLEKMEHELRRAKEVQDGSQLHKHMYAIKALAEVILEEGKTAGASRQASPIVKPYISASTPVASEPLTITSPEPIKTEDGANGDSLFDF